MMLLLSNSEDDFDSFFMTSSGHVYWFRNSLLCLTFTQVNVLRINWKATKKPPKTTAKELSWPSRPALSRQVILQEHKTVLEVIHYFAREISKGLTRWTAYSFLFNAIWVVLIDLLIFWPSQYSWQRWGFAARDTFFFSPLPHSQEIRQK